MTSKAVDAEYKKVGAHGKSLGLFWGGDWSNPDYPHFQMRDNNELASIRDAFTTGQPIVWVALVSAGLLGVMNALG